MVITIEFDIVSAVETALDIPAETPLLKLFPTAFPEVFALLSPWENCLINALIADFALFPNASSPEFTTFTLERIPVSDFSALFAFPAIDFILEFTDFRATTIRPVPAAPATIAAANTPTVTAAAPEDPAKITKTALAAVPDPSNAVNPAALAFAPAATSGNAAPIIVKPAPAITSEAPSTAAPAANAITPAAAASAVTPTNARPTPSTVAPTPPTAAPVPKTIMLVPS